MKYFFYLSVLSALILLFNACNRNDSTDAWREANINAYDAITKDTHYKALETKTGPFGIYYKVLKTGTGTEYPLATSNVKALYKASYYDGTVFDNGTRLNNVPVEFSLMVVSPSSYVYTSFTPTNMFRGFSFALQNMVVGDKWEIWIPYYLGYGPAGLILTDSYTYTTQTLILGYSTLVYEVELVSITQYPK